MTYYEVQAYCKRRWPDLYKGSGITIAHLHYFELWEYPAVLVVRVLDNGRAIVSPARSETVEDSIDWLFGDLDAFVEKWMPEAMPGGEGL